MRDDRSAGRLDSADLAEAGEAIYERDIRRHVDSRDAREFVAIDVVSGAWEVDDRELTAMDRLRASHPNAEIYLRRIGSPYADRFGARGMHTRQ
jgi:hypothetical protein